MRVLFLDIDGVINCSRTAVAFGGYPFKVDDHRFDQVALALIRKLCENGEISICLSSSWRHGADLHEMSAGFDLPIFDKTPSLTGTRGSEIQRWLDSHPEVEEWAIIDDDGDMLDSQRLRFVHTSHHNGMMWEDFCKLCDLFGCDYYDGKRKAALQWSEE